MVRKEGEERGRRPRKVKRCRGEEGREEAPSGSLQCPEGPARPFWGVEASTSFFSQSVSSRCARSSRWARPTTK